STPVSDQSGTGPSLTSSGASNLTRSRVNGPISTSNPGFEAFSGSVIRNLPDSRTALLESVSPSSVKDTAKGPLIVDNSTDSIHIGQTSGEASFGVLNAAVNRVISMRSLSPLERNRQSSPPETLLNFQGPVPIFVQERETE